MAPPVTDDPFAAPARGNPLDLGLVRRQAWFVARRAARLAMGLLVVPLAGAMVFDWREPRQIALAAAMAVLGWLPTTAVQARVVFQPSPPDPWLGLDGTPRSERDLRAWNRSDLAEWLLGTVPPVALLVWFVSTRAQLADPLKVGLLLVLLLMIAARQSQGLLAVLLQEARLDLEALRPVRVRRVLALAEPLAAFVGRADHLRYLLARAAFREGDLDAALGAIDRIRNRDAWRTDLLRALLGIEREGPDYALAVAAELERDPELVTTAVALRALALLYLGRDPEVVALADGLVGAGASEGRWFGAILLAAARAQTEPAAARALLRGLPWGAHAARSFGGAWSAVGARLRALDLDAA